MRSRTFQYRSIVIVALIASAIKHYSIYQPTMDGIFKLERSNLVEENLAANIPSCLESLDLFDLEQLPGISPSIAKTVYDRRSTILSNIDKGLTLYEALQKIKGIGTKKAQTLSKTVTICRLRK